MRAFLIISVCLMIFSCGVSSNRVEENKNTNLPGNDSKPTTVSSFEIVKEYKHDTGAFTQGLVFHNGFLYEGTGGSRTRGDEFSSSLRKIEVDSGKVLQKRDLPNDVFGEGIVILGDKIYQLTWKEGIAYEYSLDDFKLIKEFRYSGEGWGLTTDGTNLFQSDGTHVIRVVNPENFETVRTISVFDEDERPLMELNELEYVKGEIWANIWQTNRIVRIDPESGKLLGWIDLSKLVDDEMRKSPAADVLNGIAYDESSGRLFVTGKLWSRVFEIKLSSIS